MMDQISKGRRTREKVDAMATQGFSVREIAQACGVSTQRVYQLLEQLGIEPPNRQGESDDAA